MDKFDSIILKRLGDDINNLLFILQKEIHDLNIALHDAIVSPMNAVPDSALRFYDKKRNTKSKKKTNK